MPKMLGTATATTATTAATTTKTNPPKRNETTKPPDIEKNLQMAIFKTPEKGKNLCHILKQIVAIAIHILPYLLPGKQLRLEKDILNIDAIMHRLEQHNAEKWDKKL